MQCGLFRYHYPFPFRLNYPQWGEYYSYVLALLIFGGIISLDLMVC